MEFLFELLGWWLLAIVKFLALPWFMILGAGKGFVETVLIATSGAAIGVYLVSFFGDKLFHYLSNRALRRGARVFTKSRRKLVRIKTKYGLMGLMMLGGLISVPITALLATKYFHHERHYRLKVVFGFFIWALLLSSLAEFIKLITNG